MFCLIWECVRVGVSNLVPLRTVLSLVLSFNSFYLFLSNQCRYCNCASSYVIYWMGCILSNKQYVGKAKRSFNERLNNHQKDVKKVDTIMAGLQTFLTRKPWFQRTCKIYHYRSVNKHLQIWKNSHPAIYPKRKFLDSKIRHAVPERF